MSDQVTLRPVSEEDLLLIEQLLHDPAATGEFAWFGRHDLLRSRTAWAKDRLLAEEGGALMVVRGDEPLGFVTWRRRKATPTGDYWVIGIRMLPHARGRGDGTQAHRLLARYLFAHTTAHRIEAGTEVDNIAEQKALANAPASPGRAFHEGSAGGTVPGETA